MLIFFPGSKIPDVLKRRLGKAKFKGSQFVSKLKDKSKDARDRVSFLFDFFFKVIKQAN